MKIAYIIANFPTRSETFVSREVAGLLARGFDVTVFAFAGPNAEEWRDFSPDARALSPRIRYISRRASLMSYARAKLTATYPQMAALNHTLQTRMTEKSNARMRIGRAYHIAGVLRRLHQFDHIHAHWPYATQVAALVHKLTAIPYSVSIHAHEVAHDNGHFPVIFETLRFATFCNRAAMSYLLDQLPDARREQSHLVYHGVETDDFPYQPPPQAMSPLRVVSAGRFTPTKGFDRLIRACAQARSSGLDIELTLLGDGSMADSLKQCAAALNITDYVHMPGWMPHHKMAEIFQQAHVFALLAADTYHDGLPNVVLEAMACGRPVILSPLPAASEAVTHHKEGFILNSPDDIAGCVQALATLAADRDCLIALGQAASRRVTEHHAAAHQLDRLAALFRGEASDES